MIPLPTHRMVRMKKGVCPLDATLHGQKGKKVPSGGPFLYMVIWSLSILTLLVVLSSRFCFLILFPTAIDKKR